MKEIIITMENRNIGVNIPKTSTNGDAVKNEKAEDIDVTLIGPDGKVYKTHPEAPAKKSWWDRQSDSVQVIITIGATFGAFIGLCLLGGTVAEAVKEASARKTLNSEGFKEHDKLLSQEYIARVERGLYDEPKTLEEAAARMLERSPQIIVHDSFYGTTDAVTASTSSST